MQNLIGTKMLRAYMHGFFVDNRLYGKAKAIAEPFSYDEYRARRVEEKLAEERATRITVKKKLPKVNAALAARLEKAAEEEGGKDGKKKRSRDSGAGAATRRDEESDGEDAADAGAREGGLLKDDRFAAMFKDSAFEVDEDSETYRMLHPNAPKLTKREREEMLEEHFDLESEDEDEDAEEEEDEDEAEDAEAARAARRRSAAVAKVKMYAAKDERHASAFREGRRDVSSTLTLAERAAQLAATSGKKTRVSGNKELRFEAGERGGRETVRARARASPAGTDRTGPPSRRGRRAGGAIRSRNGAGWGGVLPGGGRGGKGGRGGGRGKRR
jgi:ribosome biogenesis protein ENP2